MPSKFPKYPKPRVVIGVPSGLTSVERKAVMDSTLTAGARKVTLVEEPMAAAIGSGLPVKKAKGNLIVDIGGGTSEIAVISLGGIVLSSSLRVAGDQLDMDIVNYARQKYNLLLGERTAEQIKCRFGSAVDSPEYDNEEIIFPGRDLKSGLPRSIKVAPIELREAMKPSLHHIINGIKDVMEETPAELMPDILKDGVVLAGGSSLLRGLDRLMSYELKVPVKIAEDPISCVVRGCGILIDDDELLDLVKVRP